MSGMAEGEDGRGDEEREDIIKAPGDGEAGQQVMAEDELFYPGSIYQKPESFYGEPVQIIRLAAYGLDGFSGLSLSLAEQDNGKNGDEESGDGDDKKMAGAALMSWPVETGLFYAASSPQKRDQQGAEKKIRTEAGGGFHPVDGIAQEKKNGLEQDQGDACCETMLEVTVESGLLEGACMAVKAGEGLKYCTAASCDHGAEKKEVSAADEPFIQWAGLTSVFSVNCGRWSPRLLPCRLCLSKDCSNFLDSGGS